MELQGSKTRMSSHAVAGPMACSEACGVKHYMIVCNSHQASKLSLGLCMAVTGVVCLIFTSIV